MATTVIAGPTVTTWDEAMHPGAVVRVYSETYRDPAVAQNPILRARTMYQRASWASFDADGNLVRTGEGTLAPTADELATWTAEAPGHIAVYTKPTGLPGDIYIRFNRLPHGGASRNHATGEMEQGVSVYAATYNRATERVEFDEDGTLGGAALNYVMSGQGIPVYLLTGEEIGRGSDGEPLLRQPKILATLTYDVERGGFRVARRKGTK